MINYSKRLRKRLVNLGVGRKDAYSIGTWFQFQVANQGSERAISYLKRVGDGILHSLYGSPDKPKWIEYHNGFPACISCLRDYPESVLLRVAKFSRSIILEGITASQRDKLAGGVLAPFSGDKDGLELMSQAICLGVLATGLNPSQAQPVHPQSIWTEFKRVTSKSGQTENLSTVPVNEMFAVLNKVPELYSLPYWKESFFPVADFSLENAFERFQGTESSPVGEIHAAQEPGGKLRMFAAPYTIVQCLLRPIHDWIVKFRDPLTTDCTYNQEAGAIWAQQQLVEGNTVHSVDLSTATCRFPLLPQLETLRSLGLGDVYINALKWACTGEWVVGDELQPMFPETLSWQVGQPLGIVPSMSMFSLCHNLLLHGLASLHSVPSTFKVLGDDVVIVGDVLYNEYIALMAKVGVPISWHKCHNSQNIAEFAGYTISKTEMIRPGRWQPVDVNNHLQVAADLHILLNGEVPDNWLLYQKFHLWLRNEYVATSDEYLNFLRVNSEEGLPEWPGFISALPFHVGVIRTCVQNGLDWVILPPEDSLLLRIFDGLEFPGLVETKHLCWAVMPNTLGRQVDSVQLHIVAQLSRLLELNLVSRSDYDTNVDRMLRNIRPLFWLPPKSERVDGGGQHKSYAQLLAVYK